jgi:hypothetical protein
VRTPGNAGRAKGPCQGHVHAKRKRVHLELAPIMALPSLFWRQTLSRLAKPRRFRRMPSSNATLGKPDAGNPHVRFEEGGGGSAGYFALPLLYSTGEFLFFDYDDFTQTVVGNERKLHNSKVFA